MKRTFGKKLISVLLTLSMVASVAVMPVMAAQNKIPSNVKYEEVNVTEDGETSTYAAEPTAVIKSKVNTETKTVTVELKNATDYVGGTLFIYAGKKGCTSNIRNAKSVGTAKITEATNYEITLVENENFVEGNVIFAHIIKGIKQKTFDEVEIMGTSTPVVETSVKITDKKITTDTKTVNVTVEGGEKFEGGYIFLTTGSETKDDADSRTQVGKSAFVGAGEYTININSGAVLKEGETVLVHLYISDGNNTNYKYGNQIKIEKGTEAPVVAPTAAIVGDINMDSKTINVKVEGTVPEGAVLMARIYGTYDYISPSGGKLLGTESVSAAGTHKIDIQGTLKENGRVVVFLMRNGSAVCQTEKVTVKESPNKPKVNISEHVKASDTAVKVVIEGKPSAAARLVIKSYGPDEPIMFGNENAVILASQDITAGTHNINVKGLAEGNKIAAFIVDNGKQIMSNIVTIEKGEDVPVVQDKIEILTKDITTDTKSVKVKVTGFDNCKGSLLSITTGVGSDKFDRTNVGYVTFNGAGEYEIPVTGKLVEGKTLAAQIMDNSEVFHFSEFVEIKASTVPPTAEGTITIVTEPVTELTTSLNVKVTGYEKYAGGQLVVTTGTSAQKEIKNRTEVARTDFSKETNYNYVVKDLVPGNNILVHIEKDGKVVAQGKFVNIVKDNGATIVPTVAITTPEIKTDTKEVYVKVNYDAEKAPARLKIFRYTGDSFVMSKADTIYSELVQPSETPVKAVFKENTVLAENDKIIAVLMLSGGNVQSAVKTVKKVASKPSTPEEILKNCAVTIMKDGKVRTENFKENETSTTVKVKLADGIEQCYMTIYEYASNTGFDPDASHNIRLASQFVKNGDEITLNFNETVLPLKVGYSVIACLNVPVGPDFYKPVNSQAVKIVDKNGEGFEDYNPYPDAYISDSKLEVGATSLHISLEADPRLFDAANKNLTTLNIAVAQYPKGDAFDFESFDQISLYSEHDIKAPINNKEIQLETPLKDGYRVRAVVYWEQNKDIFLVKGNDYESMFNRPDDSIIVGAPAVSREPRAVISGEIRTDAKKIPVTLSGDIPEGSIILVKKFAASENKFASNGGTFVGTVQNAVRGSYEVTVNDGVTFAAGEKIVAFVLNSGNTVAQSEAVTVKKEIVKPDFEVTLKNDITTESKTAVFSVKTDNSAYNSINIASLYKGNTEIAKLYGQQVGDITFDISNADLRAGDKVKLVLTYAGGDKTFTSDEFTVKAVQVNTDSITITNAVTPETKTVNVKVTGYKNIRNGEYMIAKSNIVLNVEGVDGTVKAKNVGAYTQLKKDTNDYTISITGKLTAGDKLVPTVVYSKTADYGVETVIKGEPVVIGGEAVQNDFSVTVKPVKTGDTKVTVEIKALGDYTSVNAVRLYKEGTQEAIAQKFGQNAGNVVFDVSGIQTGDKLYAIITYNNGDSTLKSNVVTVSGNVPPVTENKIEITNRITTSTKTVNVKVTGYSEVKSSTLLITAGPDNEILERTTVGSANYTGAGEYVVTLNKNAVLKEGETLLARIYDSNADKEYFSDYVLIGKDGGVTPPVGEDSIKIVETKFTTASNKATVQVTGYDEFKGGYLILTTGTPATNNDADSRTQLGRITFTGADTYEFSFDATKLKAGNTILAHLYKYDSSTDRTMYKYGNAVAITTESGETVEPTVEIVTSSVKTDMTSVWVKTDFDSSKSAVLKLYTYTGDKFEENRAKEIYSAAVKPSKDSQKAEFGKGKLAAGDKLVAVLKIDGKSIVSNTKTVAKPAEKPAPTAVINEKVVTMGDTKVSYSITMDRSIDTVSYKLYQFTGEKVNLVNDTVIGSGTHSSSVNNYYINVGGKLVLGSKLQLVLECEGRTYYSNIVNVEASPDWGTPTVAINTAAVYTDAKTIPVKTDYSDEYLKTFGDEFYCDLTLYMIPEGMTDAEFEENEKWEDFQNVPRIGQINSTRGDVTKGEVTVPVLENVTLKPGCRIIAKLRLPHTEWEGEEVDYVSMSVPVIEKGTELPKERIVLLNLGDETERGHRLRNILKQLELPCTTITNDDLDETVGYVAGIKGYEETPGIYDEKQYDCEFMLMNGLSEARLDEFLGAMVKAGLRINNKAVVTDYTKDLQVWELIDMIAEENEAFTKLVELGKLIEKAEALDEKKYGDSPYWNDLQNDIRAAKAVTESVEPSKEAITKAYNDLEESYLKVTEMKELRGNAVITIRENKNGTYTVTADMKNGEEGVKYNYLWRTGEKTQSVSGVEAEDLIGMTVTITADGYHGEKKAQLEVPAAPDADFRTTDSKIIIEWNRPARKDNRPLPEKYIVKVYEGNDFIDRYTFDADEDGVIRGLDSDTKYTLEIVAVSPVGRSDMEVFKVRTDEEDNERPDHGGHGGHSHGLEQKPYEPEYEIEEPEEPSYQRFQDVKPGDYYYEAVDHMAELGLMSGTAFGRFDPQLPASRAMLACILYRLEGNPVTANNVTFKDIDVNAYYYNALCWAVENGILSGYDANTFGPDDNVTREQAITILWRYCSFKGIVADYGTIETFADAYMVSDYAKPAMAWATGADIIRGRGNNDLAPKANVIRGDLAVILDKFYNEYAD